MSDRGVLDVKTRGGVEDLGRVIGVLALLDLTPLELKCDLNQQGLRIRLRIDCAPSRWSLCVARMGALVCVESLDEVAPGAMEVDHCVAMNR